MERFSVIQGEVAAVNEQEQKRLKAEMEAKAKLDKAAGRG